MTPYPSTLGTTVAINIRLLFAFATGWVSWITWSSESDWWGPAVLAVAYGLAAALLCFDAGRLMVRVRRREAAVREYLAQGVGPKSSDMASNDDLTQAGMR